MGWRRALLIFSKLKEPPPYGSLLEIACLVVQRHQHEAELLATRATAQAAIGGEKAVAAFDDLLEHESRVEREDEASKMRERMEALKQIKEIRMRPLASTRSGPAIPRVSAEDLRDAGRLTSELRPVAPRGRARTKRTSR